MRRSVKIGIAIGGAGLFLLAVASAIAGGLYYLISLNQGQRLAREGYEAEARLQHELAITKLTGALQNYLTPADRYYVYLNRGSAYSFKRKLDDAINDFSAAIRVDPAAASPLERRGWAYLQKGDLAKATSDFTEALTRDPNLGSSHYNRGDILFKQRNFTAALADLDEAVRCLPNNAEAWLMRGKCYLALNDLDHALISLDSSIAINPNNQSARQARLEVYQRKGLTDQAKLELLEVARLAPPPKPSSPPPSKMFPGFATANSLLPAQTLPQPNAPAFSLTGETYFDLTTEANRAYEAGDYDRALEIYNRALALQLTPQQASVAVMRRGLCYRRKKNEERAKQDFDEAITLNSKNEVAYYDRGLLLAQRGDEDEAMQDYDEALRLNPKYYPACLSRAFLFRDRADLERALAEFSKASELKPGAVDPYVARAAIYLSQSNLAQAVEECDRAIQIDPQAVSPYANRAVAYSRLGKYAEALHDLETEKACQSKDPSSSLNSLAWFRATCPDPKMRNAQEAIELANKACGLSKWENWGQIDTLAAAYAEAGQFEKAAEVQQKAIDMNRSAFYRAQLQERLTLYQRHEPFHEH